ncbi:hypothetical protein GBAR_LOCUS12844, partial [Geodia barretti]
MMLASNSSQKSSHTVSYRPLKHTSTRPSLDEPFSSLTLPSVHAAGRLVFLNKTCYLFLHYKSSCENCGNVIFIVH